MSQLDSSVVSAVYHTQHTTEMDILCQLTFLTFFAQRSLSQKHKTPSCTAEHSQYLSSLISVIHWYQTARLFVKKYNSTPSNHLETPCKGSPNNNTLSLSTLHALLHCPHTHTTLTTPPPSQPHHTARDKRAISEVGHSTQCLIMGVSLGELGGAMKRHLHMGGGRNNWSVQLI